MQEDAKDQNIFCIVAVQSLFLFEIDKNTIQLLRTRISALRRSLGKRITSEVLKRSQIRSHKLLFQAVPLIFLSLSAIVTNPGGEAEVVPVFNMYYSPMTPEHYWFIYKLLVSFTLFSLGRGKKRRWLLERLCGERDMGNENWSFLLLAKLVFPSSLSNSLFCWLKPDGPSDIWWSNKVHMLNASMKQRC